MDAQSFVYWLQGAFEVGGLTTLNPTQVQVVKDHLALVLKKETPARVVGPAVASPALTPQPIDRIVQQPWTIPSLGDGPLTITC